MAEYSNTSGNVDEHVVKMTFDNKQFEKNAQQSLNTVDKLKNSMNFEATVKGLDKLESGVADANDNLSKLGDSVDKIKDRFSNLGIIGVTALQNITNSVINTGKQMIKSLTIDPVKSGFDEYELKMNSMKTIIASTGASVKQVNKYLNELNKYSDETIYSFSDMTNNIGKFTNAGVDLDTAVNAIKGVSSEAALAGANAQEASRAMYNFSQALSAGYVKLIDWKSIENANMATVDFKNQLIQTAEVLGTVKKRGDAYVSTTKNMQGKVSDAFTATKNFNDSLNHQWMTNKVLTTTLKMYATDVSTLTDAEKKRYETELKQQGFNEQQIKQIEQLGKKAMAAAKEINTFSKMIDTLQEAVQSSWAQTSEYIFGTLDQAKKLWTGLEGVLENVIMKHNDLRNDILGDWSYLGGRDELIEGFKNLGSAISSIFEPIRNAFLNVFKPFEEQGGLGTKLYDATVKFKEFAESLKLTEEESRDLQTIFETLFGVIQRIGQAVGGVAKVLGNILKTVLRPTIDILLKLGTVISSAVRILDYFVRVIGTVIKTLYDQFIGIEKTAQFFQNIFIKASELIIKALSHVGITLNKVGETTVANGEVATKVADIVVKALHYVAIAIAYVYAYGLVVIRAITIGVGALGLTIYAGVKKLVAKIMGASGLKKAFNWIDKQFTVTAQAGQKSGKDIEKSSKSTADSVNKDWDKLSLGDKIKAGIEKIITSVSNGLTKVKDFFGNFVSNVKNFGFKNAIIEALHTIYNGFKTLISNIINGLKNANIPQPIKNFFAIVGALIANIKNAVGTFFDFLASKIPIFDTIKKFIDDFKDTIKNGIFGDKVKKAGDEAESTEDRFAGLKAIGDKLADTFHNMADAVRDFLSTLTPTKVICAILAVTLTFMLTAIARVIWYAGNATAVIGNKLIPQMANLTTSLNTFVKGVNQKFFPTQKTFVLRIREIAEAVAILAGSILVLSTIDSDKLWPAVGATLALLAAISGITVVLMKLSKATSPEALAAFKTTIASLIAMAASIASIAVALKILDSITDTENLFQKAAAFTLTFVSFMTAMTIAQKFWGKGLGLANTAGVLFFALSLTKIAKALVYIAGIDFKSIQKGLKGFLICVALLGSLAVAFGRSKWHSGANAIGFAISLWMLVDPIKKLAKVDYSNYTNALKSMQGMILTLAVVAGSLMAIGMITKKGRSAIHATSAFIQAMGFALLSMVATVAIFGNMKPSILKKGITCVGILSMFITASMALLSFSTRGVKVESSFKTLMGITLSVASLVGAVLMLGMVDGTVLAKGTITVSALLTFFGVCMKLSSGAKDVKMGPVLAITGSLITLSLSILMLGIMPFNKMMQGLLGMASVIGGLIVLFTILNNTTIFTKGFKAKGAIITGIGVLITIAGTISVLTAVVSKYGIDNMTAACMGLSGVMVAIAVTFGVMTTAGVTARGAVAAGGAILVGLAILAAVAVGVFSIIELLGWLTGIKGAKKNLENFGNLMENLGKAFGKAVAAFQKQLNDEKLRFLTKQTGALSDYLHKVADINPKTIEAANGTIEAITNLLTANNKSHGTIAYESFDSKGMSEFMINLANGVIGFKSTLDDAGGYSKKDTKTFQTVMEAFSSITAASKGLKTEDIKSLSDMLIAIGGFNMTGDLDDPNTGLGGFARTFGQTVDILRQYKFSRDDIKLFKDVVNILSQITEIANKIPNSNYGGGISALSDLVGDNRLDQFLGQIAGTEGYGEGLGKTLADAMSAMSNTNITNDGIHKLKKGIEILSDLAEMSGDIPNSGGLIGGIVGNNDLGPFLEAIAGGESGNGGLGKALGSAIAAMADKNITEENVNKLISATTALQSIANVKGTVSDNSHPIMEWIENFLNHKNTFTSYIEALPAIGTNLSKAASSFANVEMGSITKMGSSMNYLSNMMSHMTMISSDGNQSLIDIKKFSKNLSKSTKDFQEFSSKIDGLDLDGMRNFSKTVLQMCKELNEASGLTDKFAGLGVQLNSLGQSMSTLSSVSYNWGGGSKELSLDKNISARVTSKSQDITNLLDSIKKISEASKEIDTSSVKSLSNVTKHFVDMCEGIKNALKGIDQTLADKITKYQTKGGELVGAIIKGMGSKTEAVKAKASEIITVMYNQFNNTGVKKLVDSGKNLLDGLLSGLSDPNRINRIKEKAKSVSDTVVNTTNKALDEHSPSKKSRKSGIYFLMGLRQGLEDRNNLSKIKSSSKSIGELVDSTIRNVLGIHSPAKSGKKIGGFEISGIVEGLTNSSAYKALSKGAKAVADVLNGTILGNLDPQKMIDDFVGKADTKLGGVGNAISEAVSKLKMPDWGEEAKKAYEVFDGLYKEAAEDYAGGKGVSDVKISDSDNKKNKGKKDKGSKSAGKALAKSTGLSEADIQNVIDAYNNVFYHITPVLDKFNKKYVKNGLIGADYIAHSFESGLSRRAAMFFGKNMATTINKEFKKYAKDNNLKKNTKEYFDSLAKFTHKYMVEAQTEMNRLYGIAEKIGGKKGLDLIKESPDLIATYVKKFEPIADKYAWGVSTMKDLFGTSAKGAAKGLQSFGDYLWENSDEGKENTKNLKASFKEEEKIRKKMKTYRKQLDQSETKTHKRRVKEAKQRAKDLKNEMELAKKKYGEDSKQYDEARKKYVDAQKEYNKLNNQQVNSTKKLADLEKKRQEQHKKTKEYMEAEAKGAAKMFKEYKDNIKSMIKDYTKLTTDIDSPINPFQQFKYSDTEANFKSGKAAAKDIAYTYTQVQSYKNFESDLEWLNSGASGFSDKVKKYFNDAGYAAADELHKMRYATKESIDELNGYFEEMAQIQRREYIRQAQERFKAIENYSKNFTKLGEMVKQGILSKEALKWLADQGADGINLVNALAEDAGSESGQTFLKEFQESFDKADMANAGSKWVSGVVKQIMATLGYVWDDSTNKFVDDAEKKAEADGIKAGSHVGKVTGESFIKAIDEQLKTLGVDEATRKQITDGLNGIFKDLDVTTDSEGAKKFSDYLAGKGGINALLPVINSVNDPENKNKVLQAVNGALDDIYGSASGHIDTTEFIKNVGDMLSVTYDMGEGGVNKISNALTDLFSKLGPMTKDEFADYISSEDGPVAQLCNSFKSDKSKQSFISTIKSLFESMYGVKLSDGVFTLKADGTTADNAEKNAQNTKKVADLTAQTADDTTDIATNTAKTTDNTAVIAEATQNIAETVKNLPDQVKGSKDSSKSDSSTDTKYSGTYVVNALKEYFKDNGMSQKGLDHVAEVLKPLQDKEYSSLADVKTAINGLGLDKEFTSGTMSKLEKGLTYLDSISKSLVTATSVDDNPKSKSKYKADSSKSTSSTSAEGAKVVIDSAGKVATSSTVTNESVEGLKKAIITGLLDPAALSAALHPGVLETGDLYNRVVNIDTTITQQLQAANQKLDQLHQDTLDVHSVLDQTRQDISTIDGDINNLKDAISSMQITLDTGTLVGALAPGIDQALGQASSTRR